MSKMTESETSKILAESHSVIYGGVDDHEITMASLHSLLVKMDTKLSNIELKNDSLESRLTEIEKQMLSLNSIKGTINSLEARYTSLDAEVKQVKTFSSELESSAKALGNIFDSVKQTSETNKHEILNHKKVLEQHSETIKKTETRIDSDLKVMKDISDDIRNSVIDLKARSMRDNLVFTGIQEDDREDTEEVLQAFLKRKFKLDYEVQFERVHRVGKYNEFSEYPRNIVAKFTYFKDREFIRTSAPKKLRGTRFYVNEQFPPEIEQKRKKLYPVMRQAKKENKRTKLVRDVLYINGEMYTPPTESTPKPRGAWGQNPTGTPTVERQTNPLKRQRQGSTPDRG